MKKLQIETVSPYLPYDLYFLRKDIVYYGGVEKHSKGITGTTAYINQRKGKLMGLNKLLNKAVTHCGSFHFSAETTWKEERFVTKKISFKPILRPLSDFNKEITVNGNTFIPSHVLEPYKDYIDVFLCSNAPEEASFLILCTNQNEVDIPIVVYNEIMNKLFEWHFDVFGFIDRGIAIDVNKIETK